MKRWKTGGVGSGGVMARTAPRGDSVN